MSSNSLRLIKENHLSYGGNWTQNPLLFSQRARRENTLFLDSKQRDELYNQVIELSSIAASITSQQIVAQSNYEVEPSQLKNLSHKFGIQEYSLRIILSQVARKQNDHIAALFSLEASDILLLPNGKKHFTESASEKIITETIAIYQDLLKIKEDQNISHQYLQYLLFGKIKGKSNAMDFFYGEGSPFQSKALPRLLSISGIHRNHHSDSTFFKVTNFFSGIFKKHDYRFAFTDKAQKILSNLFFPGCENRFKDELEDVLLDGYFNDITKKPISSMAELFQTKYEVIRFEIKPGQTENQADAEEHERIDFILKFKSYFQDSKKERSFFDYESRNHVSKSFVLRSRIESDQFSKHAFAQLFKKPPVSRKTNFDQTLFKLRKLVSSEAHQLRKENQDLHHLEQEVVAAAAFEKTIEWHLSQRSCSSTSVVSNVHSAMDIAKKICQKNPKISGLESLVANLVRFYLEKKQNQIQIKDVILEKEEELLGCLKLLDRLERLGESDQIDQSKKKCEDHLREIQNLKEKIQRDFGLSSDEIRINLEKCEQNLDDICTKLDLFLRVKLEELNPEKQFDRFFEDQISTSKIEDITKMQMISNRYEKLLMRFHQIVCDLEKRIHSNENIHHILSDLNGLEIDEGTEFGLTLLGFIENLKSYVRQKFYLERAAEYLSCYLKSSKDYHRAYSCLVVKILEDEITEENDFEFVFLKQYQSFVAPMVCANLPHLVPLLKKPPPVFLEFLCHHGLLENYEDCVSAIGKYIFAKSFLKDYQKHITSDHELSHEEKISLECCVSHVLSSDSRLIEQDMAMLNEFVGRMWLIPGIRRFMETNVRKFEQISQKIKSQNHIFYDTHEQVESILNQEIPLDVELVSQCQSLSIDCSQYHETKKRIDGLVSDFGSMKLMYEESDFHDDEVKNKIFKIYLESFLEGKKPEKIIEKNMLKLIKKYEDGHKLQISLSEIRDKLIQERESFCLLQKQLRESVCRKKIKLEAQSNLDVYWSLISKIKRCSDQQKSLDSKLKLIDHELEFSFSTQAQIGKSIQLSFKFKQVEKSLKDPCFSMDQLKIDLLQLKEEIENLHTLADTLDARIQESQNILSREIDLRKSHLLSTVNSMHAKSKMDLKQVSKTLDQMKKFIFDTESIDSFFSEMSLRSVSSLSDQEVFQIEDHCCCFVFYDLLLQNMKSGIYRKVSSDHVLLDESNGLYHRVIQKCEEYNHWIETLKAYGKVKNVIQKCIEDYLLIVSLSSEEGTHSSTLSSQSSFLGKMFSFFVKWVDADMIDFVQIPIESIQRAKGMLDRMNEDLDWLNSYESVFLQSVKRNILKFPEYVDMLLSKSMTSDRSLSHLIRFAGDVFSEANPADPGSPGSIQRSLSEESMDSQSCVLDFQQGSVFELQDMEVKMPLFDLPGFGDFDRPIHVSAEHKALPRDQGNLNMLSHGFVAQFNLLERLLNIEDESILKSKAFLLFFKSVLNQFDHVLNLLGEKSDGKSFAAKALYGYGDISSFLKEFAEKIKKFRSIPLENRSSFPVLRELDVAILRYEKKERKLCLEGYLEIVTLLFFDGIKHPNDLEKEILVSFYNAILFEYNRINRGSGFYPIKRYDDVDFVKNLSGLLFSFSSPDFMTAWYFKDLMKEIDGKEHLNSFRVKSDFVFLQILNQMTESGIVLDDQKHLVDRYAAFANGKESLRTDQAADVDLSYFKELLCLIQDEAKFDVLYFCHDFRRILFLAEKIKLTHFFIDGTLQPKPPFALIQSKTEPSQDSEKISQLLIKGIHEFILQVSKQEKTTVFQLFQIFENCFFDKRFEFISKWDLVFTFFPFDAQKSEDLSTYNTIKLMILNMMLYTIIRFDLNVESFLTDFEFEMRQMCKHYSDRFHSGKFNQDRQKSLDKFDLRMCYDLTTACAEMVLFLKEQHCNYHDVFLEDLKSLFIAKDHFHLLEIIFSLNTRKKDIFLFPLAKIKHLFDSIEDSGDGVFHPLEKDDPALRIVTAVSSARELLNYRLIVAKGQESSSHVAVVSHFQRSA